MISKEWLLAARPRTPASLLLLPSLSLSINQYLLTKALWGSPPLSALLFIFQDVIRARSEMSRSLQGKYLPGCDGVGLCISVAAEGEPLVLLELNEPLREIQEIQGTSHLHGR